MGVQNVSIASEINVVDLAAKLRKLWELENVLAEVAEEEKKASAQLLEKLCDKEGMRWAKSVCHTLSKPSKMPCPGYSIPAQKCKVGAKLREVKGSVCEGCYALKGFYRFGNVKQALEKRLASLSNPDWILAMAVSLTDKCEAYFRWHDSGDIQDVRHLAKIVAVARLTPHLTHWIPTRERGILREFLSAGGEIPKNLIIRLSGTMRDQAPPKLGSLFDLGVRTSTVRQDGPVAEGSFSCQAEKQAGRCLGCRACWSRDVHDVSYPWH